MDPLTTADIILSIILAYNIIVNLLKVVISMRQVLVFKTALKVPTQLEEYLSEDNFHRSRVHGLEAENLEIFKLLLMDICLDSIELYFGRIALLYQLSQSLVHGYCYMTENDEIMIGCAFCLLKTIRNTLRELPFEIYKAFVLEPKHGFDKPSACFFAYYQLQNFMVTQMLTLPPTAIIVFIMQYAGDYFILWEWLVGSIFSLAQLTIYPNFIKPLFATYKPLAQGALHKSIEELCEVAEFPLGKILTAECLECASHRKIYIYGTQDSKNIVISVKMQEILKYTTAAKKEDQKACTNKEVLALVAHELGHWQLGYIIYDIVIAQFHLVLLFTIFGYCYNYPPLYEAFGFEPGTRPVFIGLIIVATYVMAPLNDIFDYDMAYVSRCSHYYADEYVFKLGHSVQLGHALIKINDSFPVYDWLCTSWYRSCPTLLQRLDHLKELENDKNKAN